MGMGKNQNMINEMQVNIVGVCRHFMASSISSNERQWDISILAVG